MPDQIHCFLTNFCTFKMLETDNCYIKNYFWFFSVTHYWKHNLSICWKVNYVLPTLNVVFHLMLERRISKVKKELILSIPLQ